MRLSRADYQLLRALEGLKALIKAGGGDRELAAYLRGLPSLRRSSEAVLLFLGGQLPVQVQPPAPRKRKGVVR